MTVLNTKHLEAMTGNDIKTQAGLYRVFVDTTAQYLLDIKKNSGTANQKKSIHALKGAAANMGAEDLALSCERALENLNNNAGKGKAESDIEDIQIQYESVILKMKNFIKQTHQNQSL